ncbi:MAG: tetratricopeptide repeat protein, partial [Bacteroidales bacterium]
MKNKLFITVVMCFISPFLLGNKIDSLQQVLKSTHEDTIKIKILGNIANTYLNQLEWDSALHYCQKAIEIGENVNYPQEIFRILYW